MTYDILIILISYLLGSLSTAILTCKVMRLPDPRGVGSGNPGATNVLRSGGKKAALITLAGDALKGFIPVCLTAFLGRPESIIALAGFAAFMGHLYPVFFGLKGGKGVATALGVIYGLNPLSGIVVSITWLCSALITRISSLSALIAFLLAPIYLYVILRSIDTTIIMAGISAMIVWRHRRNIHNLWQGCEPRIGRKSANKST